MTYNVKTPRDAIGEK